LCLQPFLQLLSIFISVRYLSIMLQAGEGGPIEVCKFVGFGFSLFVLATYTSMPQTLYRAYDLMVCGSYLDRIFFESHSCQAHVAQLGPWKDFLIEGWRAVQAGNSRSAWYRYLFASYLGYRLGSYNAGAILAQPTGRSLVPDTPSVQRWMFAVSSQRGDKPAFRQLGVQLLRTAASCFPSSEILSIASPYEDSMVCPSKADDLLQDVFICLESAGPKDAESLHLLGQMYEYGIGTNASVSLAIQVLLFYLSSHFFNLMK